ncbi:MAG: hypothetical protein ACYDAS_03115 [Patescibacteria group bacterium]
MKNKLILIIGILIIIAVFLNRTKVFHSTSETKGNRVTTHISKKVQLNNIAYFTGLNYLYSINLYSHIKNTVSGYLGPGKSADSVIEIKNNEYAISNESNSINICTTKKGSISKCSQGNFLSTINGYTSGGNFINFQGVGDLALYNGSLYATDVINGAIVKINTKTFTAIPVVTGLNNPHGIYFYNNYLYINLHSYPYQGKACTLIKVNTSNWNVLSCVAYLGGYADGVAGYKANLYLVRDYVQSSGLYNASVYSINLNTKKYKNIITINKQYIDGIGYNSQTLLAVFRSANPDVSGIKYYSYKEGLYNISTGTPQPVSYGIYDGVYFPPKLP